MNKTLTTREIYELLQSSLISNNHQMKIMEAIEAMHESMAMRDYFAAKALAHPYSYDEGNAEKAAQWAYHLADAMLEARK